MARKSKGRAVKRNKQAAPNEAEEITRAPHSFVIHRGEVGQHIQDLTKDFRKVMEPFTASSLKVRKKNVIKDFVSVAGLLHVSHLVMFTRTDKSPYMRIARLPRGPTMTFRIHNYSLARDVVSLLKKQYIVNKEYKHSPLIIMNSFSGEGAHMKLMASMFQNMFPAINLMKINLDTVCRCVLFNYNQETKMIDFRHYGIKVVPVGLSRGVKKIVQSKVPNLGNFNDVSEYIIKSELLSDSEVEDDPNSHVTLPQKLSSRGNLASNQSAIRLIELGPRMSLQLIKVETGLLEGDVMFHELVSKTEEEIKLINKRREEKRKLKEQRKHIQEQNKQKKEARKNELKHKSLEGMKKNNETDRNKKILQKAGLENKDDEDEENDADWYREEVGEEPDQELFTSKSSGGGFKRKRSIAELKQSKKRKLDNEGTRFQNKRFDKEQSNFKKKRFGDNKHESNRHKMFGKEQSNFKKKGFRDNKFQSNGQYRSNKKEFNSKGKGFKTKTMGSKVTKGRRHR